MGFLKVRPDCYCSCSLRSLWLSTYTDSLLNRLTTQNTTRLGKPLCEVSPLGQASWAQSSYCVSWGSWDRPHLRRQSLNTSSLAATLVTTSSLTSFVYFVLSAVTWNASREGLLGSVTYSHHCSYKNDIQTCHDSYVFCNWQHLI
jgi:hypothetical protein